MKNIRKQKGKEINEVVFPASESLINMPDDYDEFIIEVKSRIKKSRLHHLLAANSSVIILYWDIGNLILHKQHLQGWGAKIIDRLSYDLKNEFPDTQGFSPRNLKYMRKFAESYPDFEIVQRTVALIPWRSNIALLDKVDDPEIRLWYAIKTLENGYSKESLVHQIDMQLHIRQGSALNNFDKAITLNEAKITEQFFKDPYIFDFIGTTDYMKEKELEQNLIDHIQKFLLELGNGFAFVGRQVHLELSDNDYYIDLLFYHLKLRCYIVVELKTGEFKPEYVGKLNMYLNVVNESLRFENDKPSIGLLLVKSKSKVVVEYSLSGYLNPISVANWQNQIIKSMPENLKSSLPSIEEIERELENEQSENGD